MVVGASILASVGDTTVSRRPCANSTPIVTCSRGQRNVWRSRAPISRFPTIPYWRQASPMLVIRRAGFGYGTSPVGFGSPLPATSDFGSHVCILTKRS